MTLFAHIDESFDSQMLRSMMQQLMIAVTLQSVTDCKQTPMSVDLYYKMQLLFL